MLRKFLRTTNVVEKNLKNENVMFNKKNLDMYNIFVRQHQNNGIFSFVLINEMTQETFSSNNDDDALNANIPPSHFRLHFYNYYYYLL